MHNAARAALPAACAEFPNDNPDLHRGAIWYCAHVVDAAACDVRILRSPPVEALCDDAEDGSDGLLWTQDAETTHAIEVMDEAPPTVVEEGPRFADEDGFETFARVLEEVMRGLGADYAVTASRHALLYNSRLDGSSW